MENSYSLELTYNGKNIFTIEVDGVPYSKRFSGNWSGPNHFHYIKDSDKTKEEAIRYLSGTDILSTLYPVEMDSFLPFIKIHESIYDFELKDDVLIIKGSYEVDSQETFDEYNDDGDIIDTHVNSFNYDEHICDYTDENGIRYVSESSGNCDGCFYFNTTTYLPLLDETDFYFKTINNLFYFKGLDKKDKKIIFKKSSSFLEDFSLTEEFRNKLLKAWRYKFDFIDDLTNLKESGIFCTWSSNDKYVWLKNNGYLELKCKTDDREAFVINVDSKEFEIVHKHQIIRS